MGTSFVTEQRLNRAEILAAIDYEIASIEKDQASPGWTKWTFYGGFATLVWLAIAEASKSQFAWPNAVLVLLFCSIFVDIAEYLVGILKPVCSRPSAINRFRLSSQEFSSSRLAFTAAALRLSGLLIAYCILHNSVLQYHSGWFMWFYSVLLILILLAVILSYVGFPMNLRNPRKIIPIWGKCILHIFILFPLSFALYQAGIKLLSLQTSLTASDFRLGLLGTVFLWLMPVYLSHVTQNQPLLETLKNIRRDLAFDRIDTDSALRQADIALDGMRAEDYFQSDLRKILEHLDSASKSMRQLQDRIGEANSLVQTWENSPPVKNDNSLAPANMLRAILESCDLHRKKIQEVLEGGQEDFNAYSKKKRFVSHLVTESEIIRIEGKYKSFFEQVKRQAEEVAKQEKEFRQCLDRLGQKSPHLLPGAVTKIEEVIPSG